MIVARHYVRGIGNRTAKGEQRQCPQCGKMFRPYNTHQKCCCKACGVKLRLESLKQARREKPGYLYGENEETMRILSLPSDQKRAAILELLAK